MAKTVSKKTAILKTKQYVVYPNHGIGFIEKTAKKDVLGISQRYYVINLEEKKMQIMIPVKRGEELGLRPLMSTRDLNKVFKIFKERSRTRKEKDWKIRYQKNLGRLKAGTPVSMGEVTRDLHKRFKKDDLSVMEKKLYEQCLKMLSAEISVMKKIELEEARELLVSNLKK